MISYCGIDCETCETYLATLADSDVARKKIADQCLKEFNVRLSAEQIHCTGCKSKGAKCMFAANICQIRKCNMERTQPHCAVCREYKCDKLKSVIKSAPAVGKALEALRKAAGTN